MHFIDHILTISFFIQAILACSNPLISSQLESRDCPILAVERRKPFDGKTVYADGSVAYHLTRVSECYRPVYLYETALSLQSSPRPLRGLEAVAAYVSTRTSSNTPQDVLNSGTMPGYYQGIDYEYYISKPRCPSDMPYRELKDAVEASVEWMATGGSGGVCFRTRNAYDWTGILRVMANGKEVVGGVCNYSTFPVRFW